MQMMPLPRPLPFVPCNLVIVEIKEADGRHRAYRSFAIPMRGNKFTDFTEVLSFMDHWSQRYPSHTLILHFCDPDEVMRKDFKRGRNYEKM